MIHGFPTSSYDYRLTVDAMAKRFRVVLFGMNNFASSVAHPF
jgi:hypothetical protein